MERFTSFLSRLRNRHFLVVDILVFLLTPAVALVLRTERLDALTRDFPSLLVVTLLFLTMKIVAFYLGGLYKRFWQYASIEELHRIAFVGCAVILVQFGAVLLALRPLGWVAADFPRSLPLIEGLIAITLAGTFRFSARLSESRLRARRAQGDAARVIIAGAGWAGLTIVKEMQRNPHLGLKPVAFVDDDAAKQRVTIRGVPVRGRCAAIPALVRELNARQVVIAMPSVAGKEIRTLVQLCEQAGVKPRIIPAMYELLDGTVRVRHLRDVRIQDLLRREPIQTDTSAIAGIVRGKRVLVTGGGGSIGSELCRQVLRFRPQALVILGHGENSVFEIQNELTMILRRLPPGEQGDLPLPEIHAVIADIRMLDRLWSVFERYRPEVVFHAAAHKHVPLMELNPVEAINNNVIGTQNLLLACAGVGVERFVMISSDKAVNPSSIMGASKRVAELLTRQAALRTGRPYVAVRFGNVLGSRGSVVLTFQKQIFAGGPVTVTDPDMKRYFMTIPEAVQLLLQAATLGQGGEIFMLDMGEPVKIADLASDLIQLSGLVVGRDIDIEYTGIRPGEKLYEELVIEGLEYARTVHGKIFVVADPSTQAPPSLAEGIGRLKRAALRADETAIVAGLKTLVPEFRQPDRVATVPERPNRSPLPMPDLVGARPDRRDADECGRRLLDPPSGLPLEGGARAIPSE